MTVGRRQVTADYLRSRLHYDPESGAFVWRERPAGYRGPDRAGMPAGTRHRDGSLSISIDRRHYRAARLAILYATGSWPEFDVDHVDGDPMNNRLINLRDIPHIENTQNKRKPSRGNKTGFLGVSPHRGRFAAFIRFDGRNRNLGVYDTPELAHHAYLAAKRRHHAGNTL